MGKDAERYRKIGKDTKRWEKAGKGGIDGGLIEEYGFSRVANARVLLNRRFPCLGGRGFCQSCF